MKNRVKNIQAAAYNGTRTIDRKIGNSKVEKCKNKVILGNCDKSYESLTGKCESKKSTFKALAFAS